MRRLGRWLPLLLVPTALLPDLAAALPLRTYFFRDFTVGELIADGLPDDVDRRLCAQVASCLQFDLPLHHQDEETALFPILRMRALPEDGLEVILDRLASEHTLDTDFASEIAEALELLVNGGRIGNANTVGYMLRGFFERYRRHVHWENTLIMPVARLRLTPEDLALIAVRMDANRSKTS